MCEGAKCYNNEDAGCPVPAVSGQTHGSISAWAVRQRESMMSVPEQQIWEDRMRTMS